MSDVKRIPFSEIWKLHQAGYSVYRIAEKLGTTRENIRQRLIRGDREGRKGHKRIVTEHEEIELVARYKSGRSLSKVAIGARISVPRLEEILRRHGVRPERYNGGAGRPAESTGPRWCKSNQNPIKGDAQPHRESELTCCHYDRCLTAAAIKGLPLNCGKCKPTRPETPFADPFDSTGQHAGMATTRMPGITRDWRPGMAGCM